MCLIAFAWDAHPRYRLALIANRDEFHARPTLPAQFHADSPLVYGGRDLEKGGAWLLVSQAGRFAAVTNVRQGRAPESASRSRGELVDDFVTSQLGVDDYLDGLSRRASDYGRFNLLLGDGEVLHYVSNHPHFRRETVTPGLHALSNADLDAPWPKAVRARDALSSWLMGDCSDGDQPDSTALFEALRDSRPAADQHLPDTSIGIEWERLLSSPFIVGEHYGTRASTVLLVDAHDMYFRERGHGINGVALADVAVRIPIVRNVSGVN